jgi:hypothetical protein
MRKQKQKGGTIDPVLQQFISFAGISFIVFSIILTILASLGYNVFVVILIVFSALALLFYSIMQLPTASSYAMNIQLFMLIAISGMLFVLASNYKHYTHMMPITFSLLVVSFLMMYSFGTSNEAITNGIILMIFGSAVSLVLLMVQQTYVVTKGGEKSKEEEQTK